jgi:hypothetical protein
LVLAFILPLVGLTVLWGRRRRSLGTRAWWIVVVIAGFLALSSFIALETGEREEERVEKVVGEQPIHTHEERAESFIWLVAVVFAATLLGGVTRGKIQAAVAAGSVGLAGVATIIAVLVGHSGGSLVYDHGAATAYTTAPVGPLGLGMDGRPDIRRDDDDDEDEGRR